MRHIYHRPQAAVDDAWPFGILYVLASLFLNESAEIFYSEDEALMDAILVMALMGFSTGRALGCQAGLREL
ncbi:hypothetical protein M405DRAFT_938017 [Rhizopogon salebrosus TDB-379]|nr:hypothetical protein M405DRAFT_938017 [Rhizopogon salebrosus TDB-379]